MSTIKHYTTSSKGTGGEIKKRIADFVVGEITLDGKVLKSKAFGEWEEKRDQDLQLKESNGEEYLHLSMEKFNLDTNNALRRISRHLRSSPKRIGYAGMKDRRAITIQKISIWNPDLDRLKSFYSRYVSLSEPVWSNERIEIGSLKGNEFEITIRSIDLQEKELRERTENAFSEMEKGVANYFGEQRFGGIRNITHRVGKEFLLGNFEEAVMLYLGAPAEQEEEEIAIARKNLRESKDFSKAVKEFPSKFRYERSIIHHLCKEPNDFVGAFKSLPKHLTYIFTHAYQSFLFNEIINERIESGIGLEKVEGDILENGIVTVALPGFDSELAEGKPGEIERKMLERDGIKLEDFKVKSFPELSCRGLRRRILVFPMDLKLLSIEEDDLNNGKLKQKIGFSLEKGTYATTILRELMKTT